MADVMCLTGQIDLVDGLLIASMDSSGCLLLSYCVKSNNLVDGLLIREYEW